MKKKINDILSHKLFRRIAASSLVVAAVVGIISAKAFAQEDIIITNNIAPEATISADRDNWYATNGYGQALLNNQLNDNKFYASREMVNATDDIAPLIFSWNEVQMIDEIQLYPHVKNGTVYGMPQKYNISVSLDGTRYRLVKTIESDDNKDFDPRCIKFSPQSCKYVKIEVEQLGFKEGVDAERPDGKTSYALQLKEVAILESTERAIITSGNNIASLATIEGDVVTESWGAGLQPANLVDKTVGCNNSYSSNFATSQTTKQLKFNYQKAYDVEEVVLYPYYNLQGQLQGFPKKFTVSVYDGTQWQIIAEEENTSTDVRAVHVSVGNIACTKVKIEATELGDSQNPNEPYNLQLSEIAIIAKASQSGQKLELENNIALNAVITGEEVNQSWAAGLKLDNLKDTTIGTTVFNTRAFYTSAYANSPDTTKEVIFELDKLQSINEVRLYPQINGSTAWGMPTDFKISISADGAKYKTVAQKTGYDNTNVDACIVQIPVVNCKYVKITATKLGFAENSTNQYALQLTEIAIIKDTINGIETLDNNIADKAVIEGEEPTWAKVNYPLSMLVDKAVGPHSSYTSAFEKNQNTTKTITFTYDKAQNVQKLVLYPFYDNCALYGFPEEFKVSVFNGLNWIEIPSDKIQISGTKLTTVQIDTVCTAIKIEATKLGNSSSSKEPYNFQLSEVAIIGTESDVVLKQNIAPLAEVSGEEVSDKWAANLKLIKLNDKNLNSWYSSKYATSQNTTKTLQFNFEDAYKMDKVVLVPRTVGRAEGFPVDFTVSVWNGTEWKNVATKTGVTATEAYEINFAEIDGRAVKIEVTKLGPSDNANEPYTLQLAEVEIYGVASGSTLPDPDTQTSNPSNPSPSTPSDDTIASIENNIAPLAVVSGEEVNANWAAKLKLINLNDKNLNSWYSSKYETKQETTKNIYFTYDKAYKISEVTIYPYMISETLYGYPVDFTVSLWTGDQWKTVAEKTGNAGTQIMNVTFAATDCRGVRIQVTKLGPSNNEKEPYVLQLKEVVIIGTESSAKIDAAVTDSQTNKNQSDDMLASIENNIAPLAKITAEAPAWAAKNNIVPANLTNLTLGDLYTTAYATKAETTKTIYFTYDKAYKISELTMYPRTSAGVEYGYPVDFTVSLWTGEQWKKVAEKTGHAGTQPIQVVFAATDCRGVRIQVTKLGPSDNAKEPYTFQLSEVVIIGKESSAKIKEALTNVSDEQLLFTTSRNIAFQCPVTVSTEYTKYGCGGVNLNDGNLSSIWGTNPTLYEDEKVEWAEINLLENYYIDTFVLAARKGAYGFPNDFTISVFYDGKWTDVVTKTGFKLDKKAEQEITAYTFKIPKTLGNKIRISSNNYRFAGTDKMMCIAEFAAYGTLATGKILPVENVLTYGGERKATTTIEDYAYYLKNLTDNDLTTEYSSVPAVSATEKQEIELQLFREFTISEIQIKPAWGGNGFPVDFSISVCENGKWVTVYTAQDYEKPVDEAIQRFQFEARKISDIRITVTKMSEFGGLYSVKLAEVMAYREHTGDDFDLDAVKNVVYEKQYEPATYKELEEDADSKNILPIASISVGTLFLAIAVVGTIFIFKGKGKDKE